MQFLMILGIIPLALLMTIIAFWLSYKMCVLLLIMLGDKSAVHEFDCKNSFFKDVIEDFKCAAQDSLPPKS